MGTTSQSASSRAQGPLCICRTALNQCACSFLLAVPPIIEPFAFQDGLAEGMRTRTVCGVSRGDAPLKLIWLKDGEPLPELLGANVTMLDQYSSLLSIPSLSATHSGEYTCVAKNPAAEIKYTALLQVKGSVLGCNTHTHRSTQAHTRTLSHTHTHTQSHLHTLYELQLTELSQLTLQ